jgi:hypothetical protein
MPDYDSRSVHEQCFAELARYFVGALQRSLGVLGELDEATRRVFVTMYRCRCPLPRVPRRRRGRHREAHKSGVAGVILGLESDAAVRNAIDSTVSPVSSAGHELEAVIVQHHVKGGVEAIVGVAADPSIVPELLELELNPVEVLPRDRGAAAVDALMRLATR